MRFACRTDNCYTIYRVVSNVTDDKSEILRLLSSNPIFARVTSYSSEAGMKNELISFCNNAKTLIASPQKRDSEILCDRVVQIINDRFSDEELSLTMVSNELAVSPNYLSALMKKTKKKNFYHTAYGTENERRIRYACMLKHEGSGNIRKCGYSDQHYFSYCFKKFYSESPNKIRNVNRNE